MKKTNPGGLPETGANPADIVDLRALEAPEPTVKIFTACAKQEDGESFTAHLPHTQIHFFLNTRYNVSILPGTSEHPGHQYRF